MKILLRRGSTNTEPGAVATGSAKRGIHRHCKLAFLAIHEMGVLFIASPTQSLPLPVLYSSTHMQIDLAGKFILLSRVLISLPVIAFATFCTARWYLPHATTGK